MNTIRFQHLLADIEAGDMSGWQAALSYAKRTSRRPDALRLLFLRAMRTGLGEDVWGEVPDTLYSYAGHPLLWHGVELCWNDELATQYVLDVAEHVLPPFSAWQVVGAVEAQEAIQAGRDLAAGRIDQGDADQYRRRIPDVFPFAQAAFWALTSAMEGYEMGVEQSMDMALRERGGDGRQQSVEAEREWQKRRLAEYLFGQVIPCWSVE
jgi:hypothetical protein